MGWDNIYISWKNHLPERFDEEQIKCLDNLMYIITQPCIDYVRNECKETTPTQDQNLVVSLLRLMRALLKVFDDETLYPSPLDKKQTNQIIEQCFIFSCIWSLCVSINTEYRRPYD